MRGIGAHTPPMRMQLEPRDNKSKVVAEQVDHFHATGQLIHFEIAREIAAWYQTSGTHGYPFAAFASSGAVDCVELSQSIRAELFSVESAADRDALYALFAYVRAITP